MSDQFCDNHPLEDGLRGRTDENAGTRENRGEDSHDFFEGDGFHCTVEDLDFLYRTPCRTGEELDRLKRLNAHLINCPACRRQAQAYRKLMEILLEKTDLPD